MPVNLRAMPMRRLVVIVCVVGVFIGAVGLAGVRWSSGDTQPVSVAKCAECSCEECAGNDRFLECPDCKECPKCKECEECPKCKECEECPKCKECKECEKCKVCEQCKECKGSDGKDNSSIPSAKIEWPVKIAILIPVTSRGVNLSNWAAMPMFGYLQSWVDDEGLSEKEVPANKYELQFIFSCDKGDPLWDSALVQGVVAHLMEVLTKDRTSHLKISITVVSSDTSCLPRKQGTTPAWNAGGRQAYRDGADFIFLFGDDLRWLQSKGWAQEMVQTLVQNPVYPGLGAVGPFDDSEACQRDAVHCFTTHLHFISFPMVARAHLEIFDGVLYPIPIQANWADTWMMELYRPWRLTTMLRTIVLRNAGSRRYESDSSSSPSLINPMVTLGRQRIAAWLKQKSPQAVTLPLDYCSYAEDWHCCPNCPSSVLSKHCTLGCGDARCPPMAPNFRPLDDPESSPNNGCAGLGEYYMCGKPEDTERVVTAMKFGD